MKTIQTKLTGIRILPPIIILITMGIGLYFYPQMPEQMASHWNINGQADGYMSRFWGTFLLPIINLVMYLLFLVIPYMDPKRQNIEKFRKYFNTFIVLMLVFILYLYVMTIIWNFGTSFNFNQWITPPFAALFYYTGILLEHAEMNWTIGIRTPWTLENPKIWDKTHKLGGILFKASALICLFGIILPGITMWLVIIPVIGTAFFTMGYSYWLFLKEKSKN